MREHGSVGYWYCGKDATGYESWRNEPTRTYLHIDTSACGLGGARFSQAASPLNTVKSIIIVFGNVFQQHIFCLDKAEANQSLKLIFR